MSYPLLLEIALQVARKIASKDDRQEIRISGGVHVSGILNHNSHPPELNPETPQKNPQKNPHRHPRYRSEMSDVYSLGVTMYMLLYKRPPGVSTGLPKVAHHMPDYMYTLVYNALAYPYTLRPNIQDIISDLLFVKRVHSRYNEVP